jgi:OOP family OmpA-OmpF porin
MQNAVTKTLPAIVLAAACIAAAPAQAQQRVGTIDTGFYVSGALGGAKNDLDTGGLASTSRDDKDTAWNLTAGYKFTRNWAVEVGYTDLGKFTSSGTFGGAAASANADVTAWNISAVGTLPLNDMFSIYGKVGYLRSKVKASASVGGVFASGSSSENDITAGIGVRYHITRNISAFVEGNYYGLGDNGDSSAFLVGARYDF